MSFPGGVKIVRIFYVNNIVVFSDIFCQDSATRFTQTIAGYWSYVRVTPSCSRRRAASAGSSQRQSIPRELRHVDVRCGSDPTAPAPDARLPGRRSRPRFPLDALRRRLPAVDGISINLNPSAGPQVHPRLGRAASGASARSGSTTPGCGCASRPAAFFQVNLAMLPTIHALMERSSTGARCWPTSTPVSERTVSRCSPSVPAGAASPRATRSAVADLKSTLRAHARTPSFEVSRGRGRARRSPAARAGRRTRSC